MLIGMDTDELLRTRPLEYFTSCHGHWRAGPGSQVVQICSAGWNARGQQASAAHMLELAGPTEATHGFIEVVAG